MVAELNALHSKPLRRAWKLVEASIAGMDYEQMTWAQEGRWSAANLIEHLSLGFLVTVKACKMVIKQRGPELPRPTWYQRWLAFRVIILGYLPKRVVAPKMVCPRGKSPEDAKQALWMHLVEMDQALRQCEEKFGSKIEMLSHPYLGPLTVQQWCKFHLFHVRRHMRQLHRLRKEMPVVSREASTSLVPPAQSWFGFFF